MPLRRLGFAMPRSRLHPLTVSQSGRWTATDTTVQVAGLRSNQVHRLGSADCVSVHLTDLEYRVILGVKDLALSTPRSCSQSTHSSVGGTAPALLCRHG
jgi:hypothetical protein